MTIFRLNKSTLAVTAAVICRALLKASMHAFEHFLHLQRQTGASITKRLSVWKTYVQRIETHTLLNCFPVGCRGRVLPYSRGDACFGRDRSILQVFANKRRSLEDNSRTLLHVFRLTFFLFTDACLSCSEPSTTRGCRWWNRNMYVGLVFSRPLRPSSSVMERCLPFSRPNGSRSTMKWLKVSACVTCKYNYWMHVQASGKRWCSLTFWHLFAWCTIHASSCILTACFCKEQRYPYFSMSDMWACMFL